MTDTPIRPDPLEAVDQRAAAVATAPRITKRYIEDRIVDKRFITGDTFVIASERYEAQSATYKDKDKCSHLTICMIRTANGFMVVGESAPMDPRNFDAELGRQLAYEDAFRKLWPLYAFAKLEDEHLYGPDEGPNEPTDATNDQPVTTNPPPQEKE